MVLKATLQEPRVFSGEGQSNRYVKMVIKEWGQLQRNSVKTYFINYIAQMGRGGAGELEFLATNAW